MKNLRGLITTILIVIVLFVATSSFAGGQSEPAKDDQPVYAFIVKTLNDPNMVVMGIGAVDAGKEINAKIIVDGGKRHTDAPGQTAIIENLIARKVGGICLHPAGSAELAPAVKKCNDAGIPVVNIDTRIFDEALEQYNASIATFIGSSNYDAGRIGGEYLVKVTNGKGKCAILEGVVGSEPNIERVRGFKDAIKGSDIVIVTSQPANWETALALTVSENILQAHPDIDCVWAASDLMSISMARLLEQRGMSDKVKIVAVDGTLEAMRAIQNGIYTATVAQSFYAMGYDGIMALDRINKGETLDKTIFTDLQLITQENVDEAISQSKQLDERSKTEEFDK